MNELLAAAKAVIEVWDAGRGVWDQINALRAAVNRAEKQAEKQEADFYKWWERTYGGKTCRVFAEDSWKTAQQAERERIRARAKIAAEKTFKAGGYYVGPQHYLIEQFVDALLEDGDE